MTVFVLVCNRCGHSREVPGAVYPDWYVPLTCSEPIASAGEPGTRACGGTLLGPFEHDDRLRPGPGDVVT